VLVYFLKAKEGYIVRKMGKDKWIQYTFISKVKQSRYTPWRRLGGEEV
jgi:hypothetical protein